MHSRSSFDLLHCLKAYVVQYPSPRGTLLCSKKKIHPKFLQQNTAAGVTGTELISLFQGKEGSSFSLTFYSSKGAALTGMSQDCVSGLFFFPSSFFLDFCSHRPAALRLKQVGDKADKLHLSCCGQSVVGITS